MKMTLALLLALFALTAMADTPTEAGTLQAPEPAAGIERAEPAPPSSYRGRFGSSAASRNARHLSSVQPLAPIPSLLWFGSFNP